MVPGISAVTYLWRDTITQSRRHVLQKDVCALFLSLSVCTVLVLIWSIIVLIAMFCPTLCRFWGVCYRKSIKRWIPARICWGTSISVVEAEERQTEHHDKMFYFTYKGKRQWYKKSENNFFYSVLKCIEYI